MLILDFERSLVSLEQIEKTRFMVDTGKSVNKRYLFLAIQFGYIGMFMPVFPLAATFAFLANTVMIQLTAKSYSTIARRSLSMEMETIGVWNDIFFVMTFLSSVVNAMFVAFTSTSMQIYFDSKITIIIVVLLAEHFIIMVKFALGKLIPDIPGSIRKRRQNANYLEIKAKQAVIDKNKLRNMKDAMKEIFGPEGKIFDFGKILKDKVFVRELKQRKVLTKFVDFIKNSAGVKTENLKSLECKIFQSNFSFRR